METQVDWVGHDDGTTAYSIREPQAVWEQVTHEGGVWYDRMIVDWVKLK